jgi:hypothetical protein
MQPSDCVDKIELKWTEGIKNRQCHPLCLTLTVICDGWWPLELWEPYATDHE